MRMLLAAAAGLAALALTSCDINTGATRKADCNCTPAPVTAPVPPAQTASYAPPAGHRRHRRSYAYGGARGYAWRREYSEVSVETYDYHSDSSSYVMGGESYGGSGGERIAHGDAHGDRTDGFDRTHSDAGTARYETAGRQRMDPWHGYDVDCPDQRR